MLSLKYGEQTLNMVNVYMPNDKTQQKEAIINLEKALKKETKIKEQELIILGDWNFVEDQIDRSPNMPMTERSTEKWRNSKHHST